VKPAVSVRLVTTSIITMSAQVVPLFPVFLASVQQCAPNARLAILCLVDSHKASVCSVHHPVSPVLAHKHTAPPALPTTLKKDGSVKVILTLVSASL
jgi:hypothetical protein